MAAVYTETPDNFCEIEASIYFEPQDIKDIFSI